MTATVSTTRNRTAGYFLYRLKSHKTAVIMSFIFGLLAYPLCAITTGMYLSVQSLDTTVTDYYDTRNFYEAFGEAGIVIMCIALFAFVALAYSSAVRSFNYLHDKTVVDMSYSLPLTRTQRFTGDFLAGLCSFTVPYIISSIIGFIIIAPQISGYYAQNVFSIGTLPDEAVKLVVTQILCTIAQCMLAGLIFLIMLYVFTVLISSFCGTMLEASFYPIVVMLMIPAIELLAIWAFYFNTNTIDFQGAMLSAVEHFSPFGIIVAALSGITELSIYNMAYCPDPLPGVESVLPISVIICNIIITAAAVIGSYFSHKSRKVERVGQPFMSRTAYYIYLSMLMFAITSLCTTLLIGNSTSSPLTFMLMIFITLIVYLVIDVATKRGFKKLLSGAVGYVAMVGGSALLTFLLICSNGFGADNNIPSADSVSKCTVSFSFAEDSFVGGTYTDRDAIATIVDLNKEWVNGANYSSSDKSRIQATYYTAFGSEKRSFCVLKASVTEERVNTLLFAEEYKLRNAPNLQSFMHNSYSDGAKAFAHIYDPLGNAVQTLDHDKTVAFYEALNKDWLAVAPEDLPSPQVGFVTPSVSFTLNGVEMNDDINNELSFPILACYENALAVLANEGITLAPAKLGDTIASNCDYSLVDYNNRYNSDSTVITGATESEIQLLNVMRPIELCAEYDYSVQLYVRKAGSAYYVGYLYGVPAEYSDLAKSVINDGENRQGQLLDDGCYYISSYNLTETIVGTGLPYEIPRISGEKYYSIRKSDVEAYNTAADEAYSKLTERVNAAGRENLYISVNGYHLGSDPRGNGESITAVELTLSGEVTLYAVYTVDGNYFIQISRPVGDFGSEYVGSETVDDPLEYILDY